MISIFISFDVVKNTCVATSFVIMDKHAFCLHIVFLSMLPCHVSLKVVSLFAGIVALIAGVGFFSGVSALVCFQITGLNARIVALVTLKRFLS